MRKSSKNRTADPRTFMIFVKPLKEGCQYPDFKRCGWLTEDMTTSFKTSDAKIFTDNGDGHGSPIDWMSIISEDHPDWIMTYRYTDDGPFDPFIRKRKTK